ncbi:uncharacterized protein LOC131950616 [Physella acuta]|uniref:uncharacterized protein LOC131950616 n=1 Tax=Physella acuta TaxID=109671 RepID=UPI0027DACA18|nr:uncharacterized protein LOC131950616 [Physella acuta]
MLFTGHDIASETAAGNPSRTCTKYGVSIIENQFSGMVGLDAARQLGRSLSAVYDKDTSCSDAKQFVMSSAFVIPVSAVNEGNPWKFSTCSVNSFKSYLRTGFILAVSGFILAVSGFILAVSGFILAVSV